MNTNPSTKICVLCDTKEVFNIQRIYKGFVDSRRDEDATVDSGYIRTGNGSECYIGSRFGGRDIPGTIRDYDIVHITEPGFNPEFMEQIDRVSKYPRRQSLLVESSGCKYGSDLHQFWNGPRSDFGTFFTPWHLNSDYRLKFENNDERYAFEDNLSNLEDVMGHAFPIHDQDPPAEMAFEAWMMRWEDRFDFSEWDSCNITLENLKWYYRAFQELNGSKTEIKRQYPTRAGDAFQ